MMAKIGYLIRGNAASVLVAVVAVGAGACLSGSPPLGLRRVSQN